MRIRTPFTPTCLCFLAVLGCGSESTPPKPPNSAQPSASARNDTTSDAATTPTATATPTTPALNTPMAAPSAGTAGAAGGANTPAPMNAPSAMGKPASMDPPAMQPSPPAGSRSGDALSEPCDLQTKWAGDEYCIKPPPADKGFQIHIGPSDYESPDPKYLLEPGTETNENFPTTSGNQAEIYYYVRQYRMRPGSHHLILTAGSGGFGGRRLGGSQNLARDNPENGIIAPEDQGVGIKLGANTPLTVNLHYFNFSDKPMLKQAWVNVWYRDANDVTMPANEMYSFAPINVPAGKHIVLRGTCPITQAGRILSHYGHRHANNLRFSTWRERGGKQELIYEDFDWHEPLTLQYSSTVMNRPADTANKIAGGWSGMLDLAAGDNIIFECEIVNNTGHTFRGANEAEDDEMCILIGDTVQTSVPAGCSYKTTEL